MNTSDQESPTQDDTQGHRLVANVNETVDSDDEAEGHALVANVNETVDSDGDGR